MVLEKNCRKGHLEIDLITIDATGIHFGARDPRIRGDEEVLFDIVAVTFNGPETVIEYIPQAFIPIYT